MAVTSDHEVRRCGAGRRAAVAALALAGCSAGESVVAPVIDVPVDDLDATASPLDDIVLTVAHARSDRDLVSQTFSRGEPIEMPGIPFGDDMVLHMSGFIGASNVAYGRTCPFGVAPGGRSPTPHLFFSRSVKFASLGITPVARNGGLGISYLGAALLVGGSDGAQVMPGSVTDVEFFDPLTGLLTTLGAPVMARDRAVQALVGTSPPRVVVIGGTAGSDGAKFIEVLDESRIDRLDSADMARIDLTATALTDGRVIVIGGNAPGQPPSSDIDEIAENGASLDVRKLGASLVHARSRHTATRLGEDVGAPVLIAGGVDALARPIPEAELFKPLSEELAKSFTRSMRVPRYGHTAMLMPDGSVLFIGGLDAAGSPVAALELFSLDAGFSDAGALPSGAGVLDFAATPLPDGRILLTGGRLTPSSQPVPSAYIIRLNPLSNSVDVIATDHLAFARAGHQAVALCDGTILITGGTGGPSVAERYNPAPIGRR